jgi:hypothetical protein
MVALSVEVVGALSDVESVFEVVAPLGCTVATGADFLINLCDLRTGSFVVDSECAVLAPVRSVN